MAGLDIIVEGQRDVFSYTFRDLERTKPLLARCVTRALLRRQASHLTELAERVADRT